jgi:hypothetical protein
MRRGPTLGSPSPGSDSVDMAAKAAVDLLGQVAAQGGETARVLAELPAGSGEPESPTQPDRR